MCVGVCAGADADAGAGAGGTRSAGMEGDPVMPRDQHSETPGNEYLIPAGECLVLGEGRGMETKINTHLNRDFTRTPFQNCLSKCRTNHIGIGDNFPTLAGNLILFKLCIKGH